MNLFFVPQQETINDKQYIEDHNVTYGNECIRDDNCSGLYAASLIHLSEISSSGGRTGNHSEGIYRTQCRYCYQSNAMPQKAINPSIDWDKALPKALKEKMPAITLEQLGQPTIPREVLDKVPREAIPALNVPRFATVWNGVQHHDRCPFASYEVHEKAVPKSAAASATGQHAEILSGNRKNLENMRYTPDPKSHELPDQEYKQLTQEFFDIRKARKAA